MKTMVSKKSNFIKYERRDLKKKEIYIMKCLGCYPKSFYFKCLDKFIWIGKFVGVNEKVKLYGGYKKTQTVDFPHFIQNKPCRDDKFDGKSQKRLAKN